MKEKLVKEFHNALARKGELHAQMEALEKQLQELNTVLRFLDGLLKEQMNEDRPEADHGG